MHTLSPTTLAMTIIKFKFIIILICISLKLPHQNIYSMSLRPQRGSNRLWTCHFSNYYTASIPQISCGACIYFVCTFHVHGSTAISIEFSLLTQQICGHRDIIVCGTYSVIICVSFLLTHTYMSASKLHTVCVVVMLQQLKGAWIEDKAGKCDDYTSSRKQKQRKIPN